MPFATDAEAARRMVLVAAVPLISSTLPVIPVGRFANVAVSGWLNPPVRLIRRVAVAEPPVDSEIDVGSTLNV